MLHSEAYGDWKYDQTIFSSLEDADLQARRFPPDRTQLLVQFVDAPLPAQSGGVVTLACAYQHARRMIIFTRIALRTSFDRTLLTHHARNAQPEDELDAIMKSITPTVLHELCHVICRHIVDIGLLWPFVPKWFDPTECLHSHTHAGPYICYMDYECRTLAYMVKESYGVQEQVDNCGD